MKLSSAPKPPAWRRWLAIVLRSAHVACVVLLGAALLGAPLALRPMALLTLGSGGALFLSELLDARIRLDELAGWTVLAKLALVAWMAQHAAAAPLLFWLLLALSGLMSHAPRALRHWQPRRRGNS